MRYLVNVVDNDFLSGDLFATLLAKSGAGPEAGGMRTGRKERRIGRREDGFRKKNIRKQPFLRCARSKGPMRKNMSNMEFALLAKDVA